MLSISLGPVTTTYNPVFSFTSFIPCFTQAFYLEEYFKPEGNRSRQVVFRFG